MSIILYGAPMSSATPVACALVELDVPHEHVTLDLEAKEQKRPEFLALNPNGKVPTLVVDGTPIFEALAIMQWLGERYGVESGKWPAANSPDRLRAMSWSAWAYVSFLSALGIWMTAASEQTPPATHNAAAADFANGELQQQLAVLDDQLKNRANLLGEAFSLADLIVASCIGYGALCGVSVDGYPNVKSWLARCQGRPSFKRAWV